MIPEILKDARAALWSSRGLFAALVLAVALVIAAERLLRRAPHRTAARWIPIAAFAATLAAGLRLGWREAFLCDDAYISFRYAKNFADGHGLVWNKGEWVEGYTNFLWTLLLGLLHKLGADIPLTALAGCLLSFAVALAAVTMSVRRTAPSAPLLPFAAIALAGSLPFHTFSTSGLETMPAAALVALGMLAATRPRGARVAGLSFTAATLMRPDHVLFLGCFGLAMVAEDVLHGTGPLRRRLDLRRYLEFAAPFVLLYIPYFLLRWRAYGDFFPNTYYAKNGAHAHWRQGAAYATHFIASSGAWAWLPLWLVALVGRARSRDETRGRIFALLAVLVFGRYVVRVGGDFMEYRFFVPLLPVVFVTAEVGLRWHLSRARSRGATAAWTAAAALGTAAALLPIRLIPPRTIKWGIAREPSFYRIKSVSPLVIDCSWERLGKNLRTALTDRGVEPPLAAAAIGMLGYHSGLPIVDVFGLINRAIAHKPFRREGRPGHEKEATTAELLAQGAVLDVNHRGDPSFRDRTEVRVGGAKLHFLRFDPYWVSAISRLPGAVVPHPERDVGEIARAAPRERVLSAHTFYRQFLDGHPLRAPLLAQLERRLAAVTDFEKGFPEGARVEGDGLSIGHGRRPGGASGEGWLTSLPDRGKGVGRLEIPIPSIPASELRFALGGSATDAISVKLFVDGQPLFRASPNGGPDLVPISFRLDDLRGRPAVLVIEDAAPAGNRGIIVDAIHFAAPENDVRSRIARLHRDATADLGDVLQEARTILPEADPDRRSLESRVKLRYSLDELPDGTTMTGQAFGKGPVAGALPGQGAVVGFEGKGFLNSYHGGDGGKGRVELPMFEIPAEPIVVLVGGGRNCSRVYVGLEVDGRIVRRACGRDDEALRRELLPTSGVAGKRGRIVIVDDAEGGWGHILADEILILQRPSR